MKFVNDFKINQLNSVGDSNSLATTTKPGIVQINTDNGLIITNGILGITKFNIKSSTAGVMTQAIWNDLKSELNNIFAPRGEYATKKDLDNYAKQSELDKYAKKTDIPTETGSTQYIETDDFLIKGANTVNNELSFNIKNGNNFIVTSSNFTVDTNGQVSAKGGFYESSDRNLKENINTVSDTDKVKNVELKEFNFKNTTTKKYGVIAQEVEEAGLDNLVNTSPNGEKSVDYISFLILKIAQLEEEIKELKSKQ